MDNGLILEELNGEIKKVKARRNSILKKEKGSELERIYIHETGNIIEQFEGLKYIINELQGKEKENYEEKLNNKIPKFLEKVNSLEEVLSLSNLSETELRTGKSNFYQMFLSEKELYLDYLKESNISSEIIGVEKESDLNPGASRALVSTLFGNSIKWAPTETEINAIVATTKELLKINLENKFGNEAIRKDIGMNKGIGTKYMESFVKNLGGTIKRYNQPIVSSGEKVYGVELRIPLKKS